MTPNIATDYEIRETMTTRAHEVQVQAQRVVEAAKHLFVTGVMSHGGHETQGNSFELPTDCLQIPGN